VVLSAQTGVTCSNSEGRLGRSRGKDAQRNNIMAARTIAEAVKSVR